MYVRVPLNLRTVVSALACHPSVAGRYNELQVNDVLVGLGQYLRGLSAADAIDTIHAISERAGLKAEKAERVSRLRQTA